MSKTKNEGEGADVRVRVRTKKSPTFIEYHFSHFYLSTFLFSSKVEGIELFIRENRDEKKCMNEENERNE
jgi:hypothetical protein